MKTQLVTILNRVNNAAIRRIKNDRGDLIYVVPSYTLPDNVVMNGGLYPPEEIEQGYKSLEDTPAPAGHPMDSDGNFVTANTPDGILYYQCGIFNKNVQRVEDDNYGFRVYVEKHIHVSTAMQTDRGRAIIEAIDKNQPIHTSTGILLNRVDESGVSVNGKDYTWRAEGMQFDHDAILLNEEGAATPSDGVGMMVNHNLIKQVTHEGQSLSVNSATLDVNQSFNDLRELLQTKLQKKFGDDETHVWLNDFGDDYAVFENGEVAYMVKYMRDDESIMLDDELEEVKRKTLWERVSSGVKSVLTSPFVGITSNKEGDEMFKEHIEKQLKANSIDTSNLDDAAMLEAYESLMANAAEKTAKGEQSQPDAQAIQAIVNEAVKAAMDEKAEDKEKDAKAKMAEKLKANGVDLPESDVDSMSVNALQILLTNSEKPKAAYGLAGGQSLEGNSKVAFDELPE